MSDVPGIDPEMLERLRRGVPLVLAPTGRFRFDGEDVTHPRVAKALRAGLDVTEEGEPIVYLGEQWCYLSVEDCPLRVTGVWEEDGALWIRLDDGRTLPLPTQTLWEEPDAGLRVSVPARHSGRPLSARFTNAATAEFSTWVVFDDDDAPLLTFGGTPQPIPATPPLS